MTAANRNGFPALPASRGDWLLQASPSASPIYRLNFCFCTKGGRDQLFACDPRRPSACCRCCQLVKLGRQGRTWLASFQCRGAGLEWKEDDEIRITKDGFGCASWHVVDVDPGRWLSR